MPKVEIDLGVLKNICFVVMPFNPTFDREYAEVIRPAIEEAGLESVRADELKSKPQVIVDIWKAIRSARVVVADVTGMNTNVFYELGIAHTLGKSVIIITRNQEDVPFDVRGLRYRHYNVGDPFWGRELREALAKMISDVISEEDYGSVFDSTTFVGDLTYEKSKEMRSKVSQPYHNVEGVWIGNFVQEQPPEYDHQCTLTLSQKGEKLSGKMVITIAHSVDEAISIVEEILAGSIVDDKVSLNGVSYSYVNEADPNPANYNLDGFSLNVSPSGTEMRGTFQDINGKNSGPAKLRLVPEKSTKNGG